MTRGTGRPTILDVAARAGVSKSLVSMVLRGEEGVSEPRRDAVMRAMTELGYRPNAAARSLVQQRTNTIGAVLSNLANPWFIDLLGAMRTSLTHNGFNLFLAEGDDLASDSSILDAFVEARVDGLLCVGTLPVTDQLVALTSSVPTVVASAREPDLPYVDVVTGDDRLGASAATGHLIELGHKRIAQLAGTGRVAELRAAGYEDEMVRRGLREFLRTEVSDRSENGDATAAENLLGGSHDRPTAVLANNDYAALIVMSTARAHGLTVPNDLSVVGYDNTRLARTDYISLTTVDNSYSEMGALAVERLLARIREPRAARTVTLLDPHLRIRNTTMPMLSN
nr:LacI family DNA-binding transcriptional regulator [Rhodococcus sp. (in: high G+C Gram-positive bacteria)]